MFWIYIGLYTFFLICFWGFFIIAKIHAYKFKNFSHNIKKMTGLLMIGLIILSFLGYIAIIFGYESGNTVFIDTRSNGDYSEIDY